jgi:hypothetical protein
LNHHELDFALVYLKECKALLERMRAGSPALREQAIKKVNDCLEHLKHKKPILRG